MNEVLYRAVISNIAQFQIWTEKTNQSDTTFIIIIVFTCTADVVEHDV